MGEANIDLAGRELVTGQNHSGRLTVTDREMRLRIISFDKPFQINSQAPIFFELENGQTATLLHCIPSSGPERSHRYGRSIFFQNVSSDLVIFGSQPWRLESTVRSVRFRFVGSEEALFAPGIIERRYETEDSAKDAGGNSIDRTFRKDIITIDYGRTSAVRARVHGSSIHIFFGSDHSTGPLQEKVEFYPIVSIDFDTGKSIDDYIVVVSQLVALFALSIGQSSHPSEIRISHLTTAEIEAEIEATNYQGDFQVRYVWPATGQNDDDAWIGSAVLQVSDDRERSATAECLATWLNRGMDWRMAYRLMNEAMRKRGRIDRDRLLTAFGWFEAIPVEQYAPEFSTSDVASITEAAVGAARQLNPAVDASRIGSLIKMLGDESMAQRLRRIIPTLRAKFGDRLVPLRLEQDCVRAVRIRGTLAHGRSMNDDEASFQDFLRSIYAMECAAFLLTIRDLPLSDDAPARISGHPLMNYRFLT